MRILLQPRGLLQTLKMAGMSMYLRRRQQSESSTVISLFGVILSESYQRRRSDYRWTIYKARGEAFLQKLAKSIFALAQACLLIQRMCLLSMAHSR